MCTLIVLSTVGCSSSQNSESIQKKIGMFSSNTYSTKELAKAFQARGFYKTKLLNINYLEQRQCSNFELQSHRGSVSFPENSIEAVRHALDNNFDVVEIDVMLTRSDDWIVHHDKKTGRATGTVDNIQRKISYLRRDSYGYLRHKDMQTGLLTNNIPPTFAALARAFNRFAGAHQKLNIEIKTKARRADLEVLEYLAYSILGKGNYFYSSLELDTLTRVRDINPYVYLTYIQSPSKVSMNLLARDLQTGAGEDPTYLMHKDELEKYKSKANRYAKVTRYDNSAQQFKKLRKALKSNYGLNIDIRHFINSHKYVSRLANQYEVPIGTYTINTHDYHENSLMQISKVYRPDTVIIDDSVYGFCNRFGLPSFTPIPGSETLGKLVMSMPRDLDLNRIDELQAYSKNGIYPNVNGQLSPIDENVSQLTILNYEPVKRTFLKIGERQQQEDYSLETGEVLELELRQK